MERGRGGGVGEGVRMGGSGRKKEIGGVCKNFEKIFLFFLHIRFFFFFDFYFHLFFSNTEIARLFFLFCSFFFCVPSRV